MSYAIIRNSNHKVGAVHMLERHNERRNKNYSNKDIDLSRSHLNYHLKEIGAPTYQQEFDRIRTKENLKGNLRLHGEKQSTVMCEFLITSDKDFFDKLGEEKTKKFFNDAYHFVSSKVGGEQYIVSAVVHMDEKTPHMHVAFIPVIHGKDKKKQPCKRINCSEFWKGRDSYARLQDEYFDFITNCGYNLERGVKGSTAEHLSVAEFKLHKAEEQYEELSLQLSEIQVVDDIENKSLPFNMIMIKKSDYETLTNTAKAYVTCKNAEIENIELKSKCEQLSDENHIIKEENKILSSNLQQLDYEFGRFYADVSDEIVLKNENNRLSNENAGQAYQIQTLTASVKTLQEEKVALENEVSEVKSVVDEKSQQIALLNNDLNNSYSLLKALEEKYDRVMKFIENMKLKEKLEEFLKPVVNKHKSR